MCESRYKTGTATDTIKPNDILSRLEMPMTPATAQSVLQWISGSETKQDSNLRIVRIIRSSWDELACTSVKRRVANGLTQHNETSSSFNCLAARSRR